MNGKMIPISKLAEVNPKTELHGLTSDSLVSFIPMADITEAGRWVGRQTRHLHEVHVGYTAFSEDDVLFAKITPCMENGKGAHLKGLKNGIGFGSTEFHVLRAQNGNDPRYIFHWLQAKQTRLRAIAYMGGSAGQQRVQKDFFVNYRVPHIDPSEQTRIAFVLDTIDDAIARAEAVITKLKQVRAGMLHDLLSYGLDEHGQLRDPIAHPEQFKDSPLGHIPKEWDVVRCREVIKLASGLPKTQRDLLGESGGEVPVYGGNGITGYTVQPLIKSSTVVIGRVGAYCGKVHLTPKLSWITDNALFVKDLRPDLTMAFLYHYFDWWDLTKLQSATGQPLITQRGVGEVLICIPQIKEQNEIVKSVENFDQLIDIENKELLRIELLKLGLQDDLLTGRVRVPESIMEGAAAV
jgi:type I restriction enzyme S subunit